MTEKETAQTIVKEEESNTEASSETNALIAINTTELNQESLKILNQIIAESDVEKTKDLTYLFNVNQNKKTMVRLDNLSQLQDRLVDLLAKRVTERPDEMPNQEIMNALKIIQDIIDRGTKQIITEPEKPLIQINTQTNNIGEGAAGLTRDSRKKVEDAVLSLINGLAAEQVKSGADVVDAELAEDEDDD